DAPVAAVLAGAPVPDPSPDRIRIRLGPDDAVAQVDHAAAIPGAAGAAVLAAMAATITPLAALSGAGVRSLWAIASDALANRALDTAGRGAVPTAVADFAAGIAPVLPPLRFVEVAGAVFVRRNSCCLYYASPLSAGEKCASCPRRLAGERRYRIAALS
ncbi:MAG: (2Fe-2S)-binding protein, partial [Mycobacteriaceae bacterium]|nr:(2Fe-2S)-binding protein [Mycobacteriaceae bacterium]